MKSNQDWRASHLIHLRALTKPSELQRRLLELHGLDPLDDQQQAELEAIWLSERQKVRANEATIRAKRITEKRGSSSRKLRTRRLIELGGLVEIAHLGGDRGVLLGGLLHLEKLLSADGGTALAREFKLSGDAELHRRDATSRRLKKIVGLQPIEY